MGKKDEEPPPIDAATRRTVANIQADWDNRELVEIVQLNLLTITKFLNDFDSATRYKLARVNEKLTRLERTLDSCEAAVRATLEGDTASSSPAPVRKPPLSPPKKKPPPPPSSSPSKKKPPPSPPKKKPPPPPMKAPSPGKKEAPAAASEEVSGGRPGVCNVNVF